MSRLKSPLFIIFLIGLLLRIIGTIPGYPQGHPDEPTIQTLTHHIAFFGDFKPHAYYYGSLLSIIYAFSFIIFYIPLSLSPFFILPFLSKYSGIIFHQPWQFWEYFREYLLRGLPAQDLTFFNPTYWGRYDSAILSSFTIIAGYFLAKKLFNKPIGLITAFLIAVNYRHVLSSRLVLADAPAALFALLSVFFSVNLLYNRSFRSYVIASIALSLSLSVKYFIYIIPTFLICHLISIYSDKKLTSIKYKLFSLIGYKIAVSGVITIILFFLVNPFIIIDHDVANAQFALNSSRYNLGISSNLLTINHFSFYSLYYLFYYGLGPLLSITIVLGFFYSLVRYPKSTIILSSVIIPYLYVFLAISGTGMVRNYSVIIPFLLFFPAIIIYDISKTLDSLFKIHNNFPLTLIISLLFISLISFSSVKQSALSSFYFSQESNLVTLYKWIKNNLPDNARILGSSGIFYPSDKSLLVTRIYPDRNRLQATEEIKKSGEDWIIIGDEALAQTTENLLLNNEFTQKIFFNRPLLTNISLNSYMNLAISELADYRIKEFVKPAVQDPAFVVIHFPKFWEVKKDQEVISFNFSNPQDYTTWTYSFYPNNSHNHLYKNDIGIQNSPGIQLTQSTNECNTLLTKLSSPIISTQPNTWYSLSAWGKASFKPSFEKDRNGFFRLDFLDERERVTKTFVTRPLANLNQWENLTTAGFAPKNSHSAQVTFQIDGCTDEEKYSIDNIEVYSSSFKPEIKSEDYPYYSKPLPERFNWVTQL